VRERLANGGSVTDALYDAGFNSNSRFYESADKLLGMKPGDYRAAGRNNDIRFAVGQCSLGAILVAQSERGVCAILLGDDPHQLVCDLQDQFRQANLIGADAGFEQLIAKVVGFIEAPHWASTCHWMCAAPRFRSASGRRCGNPGGSHRQLRRNRPTHWRADFHARGGASLRRQPSGRGNSLPPRGAQRWQSLGVSLGCGAQAPVAGSRNPALANPDADRHGLGAGIGLVVGGIATLNLRFSSKKVQIRPQSQ
jgi:hypothetical protein